MQYHNHDMPKVLVEGLKTSASWSIARAAAPELPDVSVWRKRLCESYLFFIDETYLQCFELN
jgi:hypothetical protein